MTTAIVLDTGTLSMLTHPRADQNREVAIWLQGILQRDLEVVVPEIVDYELRRKLIHLRSEQSLQRLDDLEALLTYLPITTKDMRLAARLWAEARRRGRPTADERALDVDVILAAQTRHLIQGGKTAIVATDNVRHLDQFVPAKRWTAIKPDELVKD